MELWLYWKCGTQNVQTAYWLGCLMICVLSELLWECEDKYRSGAKIVWQKWNKQSDIETDVSCSLTHMIWVKETIYWQICFFYQQSLSFIMHIENFWNWPYCEAVIVIQGKCINETTLWTFWNLPVLTCCMLWLEIIPDECWWGTKYRRWSVCLKLKSQCRRGKTRKHAGVQL
jgi:hypothetical protein